MGREIKRVPMDFNFPVGESYADRLWEAWRVEHRKTCALPAEDCDDQHGPESREPPEGPGWQLWQTVSDGPISPVFATPEELIEFMVQPAAPGHEGWEQGYSRPAAEALVRDGWVCSFVLAGGVLRSGAEDAARRTK